MLHFKKTNQKGLSLVELIVAIAVFSLVVTALIGLITNVFFTEVRASQQSVAQIYAEEGIEAARSIRRRAWNLLENGTYGLDDVSGYWEWNGTSDVIGNYTRTVTVEDICRDISENIADCPADHIDLHSKKITSIVEWQAIAGFTTDIILVEYLTNWQSKDWIQTDWSGGAGQDIWSNITRYWTDDGHIDYGTAGEVKLAGSPTLEVLNTWDFDFETNYTYDSAKVEVINSFGQLKELIGTDSGQTLNDEFISTTSGNVSWPFNSAGNYSFDPAKIEVSAGLASLKQTMSIGAVFDSLEFDTGTSLEPDIINVSGNIYAIAYRGPGRDGFVRTVEIDSFGNITNSIIDTLEFDTANGYTPSIINVINDIYAVAYRGNGADGFIKTFTIDSFGSISAGVIDTLEYDTSNGYWPDLISLSSSMLAVVYQGNGADGFVRTVEIDANGYITNSVIDSFEYDTSAGREAEIINVSGNIYAIAYRGPGRDGFVKTVEIEPNGNIINSVISSYEFDTANGYTPSIINILGNTYAVVYRGNGADGFVKTISIDSVGIITQSTIDTLEFDIVNGLQPDIVHVSGDVYAIVYQGTDADGFLVIFDILSNGQISDTLIDTLEFDIASGVYPSIIDVGGGFFAITYQGAGSDGFVITVEISSSYPIDRPSIKPTASYINTAINQWTMFTETATKNSGEIYYQLSDDDGTGWYYWDGGNWSVAGASNYNTAGVINTNISSFNADNKQILWQAFLESDGSQLVQLDDIQIDYLTVDNWTYYDWQLDAGDSNPSGNWYLSGGNPSEYVDVIIPRGNSSVVGGFWQQEFTTSFDNPDSATLVFDGSVLQFPDTPTALRVYAFVDSAPGEPALGSEVWNSGPITGTTGWPTINVDVTSQLASAGTYYLKLAVGINQGGSDVGPFQVGFDNAQISWSKSLTGYADDGPTIQPTSSYQPTEVSSWTGFTEVANKNGGEIYYQLSDDDGTTWNYWDGGSWSIVVDDNNDRNIALTVNTNIGSFDAINKKFLFKAFLVGDGMQQVQLDSITVEGENLILTMEIGQIANTDHNWQTINTIQTYTNPVVIASYYEVSNSISASVRVRNAASNSFEIKLQNPTDQNLNSDVVNYMVIEEGSWDIGSARIEAHRYDTSAVAHRGNWSGDSLTYDNTFTADPIVFHQLMSENDPVWITTWVSRSGSRNNPPNIAGFQTALNCTEACTSHAFSETIGWVAIEMNVSDTVESVDFETQRTSDSVRGHDNGCNNFNFNQTYAGVPIVFSSQLEMDGNDGAWGLICNQTNTQAGFHAEEDQERDSERSHAGETFGFIAFAESFSTGASTAAYPFFGWLESSALDATAQSSINMLSWVENIPSANEDIKVQIMVASGSSGPWTTVGYDGFTCDASTFFENQAEILIPKECNINDYQWLKYRVELSGDGTDTPVLEEIKINYTP